MNSERINPEAILLDMGGVVLDVGTSRGVPHDRLDWRGREALVRFLAERGGKKLQADDLEPVLFAPWRKQYERRAELGREASWEPHLERLRSRAGVSPAAASSDELLAAWFEPFGDSLCTPHGMVATLSRLAASGRKLALVSNVPLPGCLYKKVLERLFVADPFESFHFSYDAGTRKPSPALLRSALAALELPAAEVSTGDEPGGILMVGDRLATDVAAGRAAGLTTVWVRSEHAAGPAADYEIGELSELPSLLSSEPRQLLG